MHYRNKRHYLATATYHTGLIDDMYLKHHHDAHVLAYLMDQLHWERLPLIFQLLLPVFQWWQARR
jgi:hypothetical protein